MRSTEVAAAAAITYRQLDFWSKAGLVKASNAGKGTGTIRDYPENEVLVAVAMGHLVRGGVLASAAERLARQLVDAGEATIGPYTIIDLDPNAGDPE